MKKKRKTIAERNRDDLLAAAKAQNVSWWEAGNQGNRTIHVLVTPEMAQELLDSCPSPRAISQRQVEKYAEAIRNGEWMGNFTVDGNGIPTDGFHGMAAVARGHQAPFYINYEGCDIKPKPKRPAYRSIDDEWMS